MTIHGDAHLRRRQRARSADRPQAKMTGGRGRESADRAHLYPCYEGQVQVMASAQM